MSLTCSAMPCRARSQRICDRARVPSITRLIRVAVNASSGLVWRWSRTFCRSAPGAMRAFGASTATGSVAAVQGGDSARGFMAAGSVHASSAAAASLFVLGTRSASTCAGVCAVAPALGSSARVGEASVSATSSVPTEPVAEDSSYLALTVSSGTSTSLLSAASSWKHRQRSGARPGSMSHAFLADGRTAISEGGEGLAGGGASDACGQGEFGDRCAGGADEFGVDRGGCPSGPFAVREWGRR